MATVILAQRIPETRYESWAGDEKALLETRIAKGKKGRIGGTLETLLTVPHCLRCLFFTSGRKFRQADNAN